MLKIDVKQKVMEEKVMLDIMGEEKVIDVVITDEEMGYITDVFEKIYNKEEIEDKNLYENLGKIFLGKENEYIKSKISRYSYNDVIDNLLFHTMTKIGNQKMKRIENKCKTNNNKKHYKKK